ncbi:MAG: enoyl-CoA hydratase/isomerase family protein [bacterium]|nr:enoyl-CoA hydratase/isomerase family protein [bacterium]
MSELVLTQQNGHIFEIILNRPDKRNAMNWELMHGLETAIDQAENLADVRAVIIRAEGKGFSAGIDLMGFNDMIAVFGEGWREHLFSLTATYQRILGKFERSRHPTIVLMHTYCIGMAFELALACDFRLASGGTQMGLPETRLGLIPDVGGTTRLTRLVGIGRAKELILTGRTFSAEDGERWGIVNQVTSADELYAKGCAFADELAGCAPLAVSYAKRVINDLVDVERGLQMEAWAQSILIRTEDFATGAQAMLLKEKPQWKGK